MSRFVPVLSFKSLFVAFSLAAMICAGCGDDSGPAEVVADQNEVEKWLAENPDADVDLTLEDEEEVDQ
jgi:hypothetical protein